ncbi:hypothetical protein GCM10008026_02620 [Chelatococcus composti]|nr:hypothetical protein GCM10008026_02620 [Chelatococcus composti]
MACTPEAATAARQAGRQWAESWETTTAVTDEASSGKTDPVDKGLWPGGHEGLRAQARRGFDANRAARQVAQASRRPA